MKRWRQLRRTTHGDTILPVTCLTESADTSFLTNITFSDEATIHVSGTVNRHSARIWGSQQPHSVMEYVRDRPKVNVLCGVMCNMIVGLFFFAEKTVTGSSYLDMLQLYAFLQLNTSSQMCFFQQDGAHPTGR
jgi:hypothetical protein